MSLVSFFGRGSLKRSLGSLIIFILTIAFLECALWIVSSTSRTVRVLLSSGAIEQVLPDPLLGVRLNPDVPEHDKAGFRNASIVDSPHLVALGDSQTYGTNVGREEAWPQQLGVLSGKPVYNMGVPGHGPVQELVLISHAVTLRPQWVVEAFYSGNDLYDAFEMVYTRKQLTDLGSSDQSVINAIEEAETESPLGRTVGRLFRAYVGIFDSSVGTPVKTPAENPVRRFLSEHSRLWGMLRATRQVGMKQTDDPPISPDVLWGEQISLARRSGGLWVPFEKGRIRTILMPQYRLTALNMEDPRIHEGLRLSIEAITRMSSITRKTGVRFMIVLIPTKELVFFDTFGGNADVKLRSVTELVDEEQTMWTELKNELRARGMSYIDVLPALRESLNEGESPYPLGADGHPNARGHKVIAAAVWRAMITTER